jgi:nondiscriminating glutamyl-tRNA synthetase
MRTRFPPSPTGLLHVGGLRTALYNYLLAKQSGGALLLRIEDTDQEREVPGATEDIVNALLWAGIVPDEGVVLKDGCIAEKGGRGPYIQSRRTALYREHAEKLLREDHAYRCFCTKDRLDRMRKLQEERKLPPMYDRECLKLSAEEVERRLKAGEPHVIRLKIPHARTMRYHDEIRGDMTFQGHTIDDQVLLKSDGFPTYHLANVVDDHLMEIDLVLRGEEWLSSVPKHLLLYEAFGWTPPRFGHVPLLLNKDKSKLSKRHNSVSVREYIDRGYLPEAMLNFLALLGWNPGTTQEIFTLSELIDLFSLDRVQKAGAIFDLTKLDWLQGQWMRKMEKGEFEKRAKDAAAETVPEVLKDKDFGQKAALIQDRITFFREAPEMLGYFYREPAVTVELLANEKQKVNAGDLPMLLSVIEEVINGISSKDWTAENILAAFQGTMKERNLKLGQLLWPLRAALTGRQYSPGAVEVAAVLGKSETIKRVAKARSTLV